MQAFHRLGSPKYFYSLSRGLSPWCAFLFLILVSYGLVAGLFLAPPDYQQGDAFRIIYVHVPAAFLSLFIYMFMAVNAAIGLIWRIKTSHVIAKASAPIGASFTLIALLTGSIWGKPMWGTWWVWDARLTSELILLFLYLGFIALQTSIEEVKKADKLSGLLAIVGVVNIPIIHFSVEWWFTLHQGATLSKFAKPSIAPEMLWPLLAMIAAFFFYFLWIMLLRAQREIIVREQHTLWVKSDQNLP